MIDIIEGLVYILGDDITTDDIIPSDVLTLRDTNEMAKNTLKYIDQHFVQNINKSNIIVAGENFGSGSSREEAVNVFKILGIKTIIAKSFARIYFRNLINLGIPGIQLEWEVNHFSKEDNLEISLDQGIIFNRSKKLKIQFEKLPTFLTEILEEGGILNRLKSNLKK